MSTSTAAAAAAAPPDPLSFGDVLRIDVMRRVWFAQVVSLFGDFLALFAVIAVVTFRMHGTAAQVTGLQIAYMFPIVFIGPIAGVFVDRWPLKPTLVSSGSSSREDGSTSTASPAPGPPWSSGCRVAQLTCRRTRRADSSGAMV